MIPSRDPERGASLVLGVTGGIAGGKTTVANMLEELGAPAIDFDVLARDVVAPGTPGLEEIVAFFGKDILDAAGGLDRKKLAGIVFRDPQKRKHLEALTHPRIVRAFRKRADDIRKKDPHVIIQAVVPLLFEAGLEGLADRILVVHVPRKIQVDRLMARDGIGRDQAERILDAQWPIHKKAERADFVIRNDGPLSETRKQVADLWRRLRALQKETAPSRPRGDPPA